MLDFDASKLLIIGVVALVVIGPKDLPRVLRQVGQAVTKLRRMAADFQGQFMDAMKEADLQDLQKEVAKLKDSATLDVKFDPVGDVRHELSGVLDPTATSSPALDPIAAASHAVTHENGALGALPLLETETLAIDPPDLGVSAVGETTAATAAPAEAENAAFRTTAEFSGGVGAPAPPDPSRRRKIVVPKRRAPGDRLAVPRAGAALAARSRAMLPPRRDDPRA